MLGIKNLSDTVLFSDSDVPLVVKRDTSLKSALQILKLRAGQKVKLPYPYALTLLREGLAEVDEEQLPSLSSVKKIAWAEEKSEDLQPLSEDFYLKLMLYVQGLKGKAAQGDEKAEEALRKLRISVTDLVRLRTLKIAQLALKNPTPDKEKMGHMTREEQVFYINLCHYISSWMSDVVDSIFGGSR